jgi:hypothetical protein
MKYNAVFDENDDNRSKFKTYMRFSSSTITITVPLDVAMDDARAWIEQDLKDRGFDVVQEVDERGDENE